MRNSGTASATRLKIVATLPAGAKYLSSSEATVINHGTQVQWVVDSLEPEVERTFAIKCQLGLAGTGRLEVAAAAEDQLTASAEALTRI